MPMKTKLKKIRDLAKTARGYSLPRGKTFDVHMELARIEVIARDLLNEDQGTDNILPI